MSTSEITAYRSRLLSRHGAVEAEAPDAGVAAHYGDPNGEQRALERGIAVVDLSHRGIVTVTGKDRRGWLDTLSSQWLRDIEPGQSSEFLLMDPQGHIKHAPKIFDDGETSFLIADTADAPELRDFLESMKFLLRVEISLREDLGVLVASADGPSLAGSGGETLPSWQDPWPEVRDGSTRYGPEGEDHPGNEWHARWSIAPRGDIATIVSEAESAGARLAGVEALEAFRIASWRPRLAREVDERTIPHELDWLRSAVHLHKGCYRGQESIARVFNLGRPPRRLTFLHLDGSEHTIPSPGDAVMNGERQVGVVTSVARHHELGPIALALIKRNTAEDAQLMIGTVAAAQELIVSREGFGTGRPESSGPKVRRRVL